jgi:preprotein translocase subunit SecA
LVDAAGEDAVVEAERAVTLHHIDRVWADHLALVADVREGVHLVALGGKDPLRHFTAEITMAFHSLAEHVEASVVETLNGIEVKDGRVELAPDLLKGPSSTWTYLVNDDPFRNQIGMMLTGPGRVTLAINAAALTMPLLVLWGVVDRVFRRRRKR